MIYALKSIVNHWVQQGNRNLSLIVSEEDFIRYKRACSPYLVTYAKNVPILPTHNTPPASSTKASNPTPAQNRSEPTQPRGSSSPLGTQTSVSPPHQQPQSRDITTSDIFWCVGSVFVEPLETILCPVTVTSSMDDYRLFKAVNNEIDKINSLSLASWMPSLPSFKSCTVIRFIKVSREDEFRGNTD